ncbi:MAG: cytochrome c biogenesis protein CcsA [Fibrobacteria bacterium]|nr:cytochrome c biogenesis protein CcsA [Fibrobacteria bacterium]
MIHAFYVLSLLVVIFYGLTAVQYWQLFFNEEQPKSKGQSYTLIAALTLHTCLLATLSCLNGRYPVGTPGEWLLVCTWLVATVHLITEFLSKSKLLGIFSLLPTFLGVLLAVIMIEPVSSLPEKYKGAIFSMHIVVSLAAYACFAIASIVSSMYILLFNKLKQKRFDVFFRKLPSLDELEGHATTWVYLGCLFLIIAPCIGWFWVQQHDPGEGMNPRELGIFIVAFISLTVALLRSFFNFRGMRFALSVLVCFVLLALTQLLNVHGF